MILGISEKMEKNISVNRYKKAKDLKRNARVALNGNYSTLVVASLMIIVLQSMVNGQLRVSSSIMQSTERLPLFAALIICLISLISIIVTLAVYLLRVGIEYMSYKVAKGEKISLGETFYAYKNKPGRFLLIFLLYFLIMLLAFIPYIAFATAGTFVFFATENIAFFVICLILGALITLAVAYILLLRYSLVNFVIYDEPDITAIEAMKKSAKLMNGHKLRMFRLALSFFGIIMLSLLTCGIASLWLLPYQYVTYAFFYIEIAHPGKMKPDWRPFISDAGEAVVRNKISLEKY